MKRVILQPGAPEPPVGSVVRCADSGSDPGWWAGADEPHELLHQGGDPCAADRDALRDALDMGTW